MNFIVETTEHRKKITLSVESKNRPYRIALVLTRYTKKPPKEFR